jgi:hypothetical protein
MKEDIFSLTNQNKFKGLILDLKKARNSEELILSMNNSYRNFIVTVGDKTFINSIFDITDKSDLARFVSAIRIAKNWKSLRIFSNGIEIQDKFSYIINLECYLESFDSISKSAHCNEIIKNIPKLHGVTNISGSNGVGILVNAKEALKNKIVYTRVPCKIAAKTFNGSKLFDELNIIDRFRTHVRSTHCFSCPNYNDENYKELGESPEIKISNNEILNIEQK